MIATYQTAELMGGPCDGDRLEVKPEHVEVSLWYRVGTAIDTDGRATPKGLPESAVTLPRPTRHRYGRTGRVTRAGTVAFAYMGPVVGMGF